MNKLQTDILWLGYEDDTGLWDVDWADGHDARENPVPGRVSVIEALAADGLIEVLEGPESVGFDGAHVVDVSKVAATLRDPQVWQPPDRGDRTVRFRTTDKGLAAYREAIGWRDDD